VADIDSAIRALRIITGANLASLLGMAVVVLTCRSQLSPSFTSEIQNGLLGLAAVVAVVSAAGYFALRRKISGEFAPGKLAIHGSAEPLLGVLEPYRRLAVLRAALIEAPGLLGLLTYLVGGSEAGLLIAGGSVLLLVGTMPSRESLQRFADGLRE